MKNTIKYNAIVCGLSLMVFSGCMDDDLNYPESNKPVVSSDVTNSTVEEGQDLTFTLNLSRALGNGVDVKIEQVSGTATADDYTFSIGELDEYEIGPAGFQTTIPATQTSTQVTITPTLDLDVEGPETATFRIVQGQNGLGVIEGGEIVFTVTFGDFEYCFWTLETSDTYGDGWQGAHIELDSNGMVLSYAEEGESSVIEIPVGVGLAYTWTYVSGGGNGGAPGYENENYYKLTSPTGAVFEDGTMDYSGIPTPGVITSGTNVCQ